MTYLPTLMVAFFTTVVAMFGVYNFMPLENLGMEPDQMLGSTITTIAGSDTLSSSRAVINANFDALNSTKIENSTTSVAAITTLSNLTTIGTVISGVWNGTAVTAAYGGTGSTTLSSNQVLLGNGTGILKTVSGLGTSGQFLTSQGAGSAPTWTSASVDQTIAYTWTGLHTFNNATTTIGSSSNLTVASSTPVYGYALNVGAKGLISSLAVGTQSSLLSHGVLTVSGTASTTNLVISGTCTNCMNGYTQTTNTGALSTSNDSDTTVTATCTGSKIVMGGGVSHDASTNGYVVAKSYPASSQTWTGVIRCEQSVLGGCAAGTMTTYAICLNP